MLPIDVSSIKMIASEQKKLEEYKQQVMQSIQMRSIPIDLAMEILLDEGQLDITEAIQSSIDTIMNIKRWNYQGIPIRETPFTTNHTGDFTITLDKSWYE